MRRLSRAQWPVVAAFVFFVLFEIVAVYIFILNRRLTNELVSHRWSQPTEIRSAATNARVATLYGVDWRITPPVALEAVPAYVPKAFLAAEDVRFHSHFGI